MIELVLLFIVMALVISASFLLGQLWALGDVKKMLEDYL